MGLGFLIHGKARGRGLLRRKPGHAELCHRLQDAVFQAVPDPLQHRLLRFQAYGEGLEVTFHPAAEPVDFRFTDGGRMTVSAKTSTVGPGYHAMLVELLDAIGPAAGIDWDWRDHGEGEGDETGYHEDQDFGALQEEMLAWLKGLADHLLQLDPDEMAQIALSMPIHYGLVTDRFAHSQLGFWDREWFEALSVAEGDGAAGLAASFFPWWNHPADAAYWRDCGLAIAWTELSWTPPINAEERQRYELTAECFARARKLNPEIGLPLMEIEEIGELLAEENPDLLPRPEGIGYRRGPRRYTLGGGWSIELPGYFREHDDNEDAGAILLTHGRRGLRVTSYTVTPETPGSALPEQMVREVEEERSGKGFCASHDENGLLGWGNEFEAEHEDCWHFQAIVGKDGDGQGELCVLTFTYEDPAEGRDWALEAFRSIRHQED